MGCVDGSNGENCGTVMSIQEKSEQPCIVYCSNYSSFIVIYHRLSLVCILINSKHGVTVYDQAMLEDLQSRLQARSSPSSPSSPSSSPLHVPILQPVLTKIDTLEGDANELSAAIRAMSADIAKFAPMSAKPILCSVTNTHRLGLDALRVSMAKACER